MNDMGIIHIPLYENDMPAYNFKELIGIFDGLYFVHIWLSSAENTANVEQIKEKFEPEVYEKLYIKTEIGTPNFIELIGQVDQLMPLLGFVSGLLGLPYVIKNIINIPLERKKAKLDIEKTELEIREKELKLTEEEYNLQEKMRKAQQVLNFQSDMISLKMTYNLGKKSPDSTQEILCNKLPDGKFEDTAEKLFAEKKITKEELDHKLSIQNQLISKANIFLKEHIRTNKPISITIFDEKENL